MKTPNSNIILIFLLAVGVAIVTLLPGEDKQMIHPMTNDLAVRPDHMIMKAFDTGNGSLDEKSMEYVEKAIESMRVLERDADLESDLIIEAAIRDLKQLEKEVAAGKADLQRINQAFLNALNSLAVAQLRESEAYLLEQNYNASRIAMEYANRHIQCALKFSNQAEALQAKQRESSIATLAHQRSMTDEQVRTKINELIREMDAVVLH